MLRWDREPLNHSARTRRRQSGFSLLELVIVIILVILLFLVAFERLLPLRGEAEAAHVTTVIGALKSAIGLAAAERVVQSGLDALEELASSNPMDQLQEWPNSYIGVVDNAGRSEIPPGAWYFDSGKGAIGYRVRYPQYLEGQPREPVHLKWKIELRFRDRNNNDRYDAGIDRIDGLGLQPRHDHQWSSQQVDGLASN